MFLHSNIGNVQFHFATPLMQREWPDAAAHKLGIMQKILDRHSESEGVVISNQGGWQSSSDLLLWGGDDINAFTRWIVDCVYYLYSAYHGDSFKTEFRALREDINFQINCWANINDPGSGNAVHNHGGSHWSGVYYLEVPSNSGDLYVVDPRLGANMQPTGNKLLDVFAGNTISVVPRDGLTVLFPSWLYHAVAPNQSDSDRISIAFNVVLKSVGGK